MTRMWMVTAAGLCVLMAATAGCYTKEQYDRVVLRCNRANEELTACQGERSALRSEKQNLLKQLGMRDDAVTERDQLIAKLNDANRDLVGKAEEYRKKLDEYAVRPPPFVGPLPAEMDKALTALARDNADMVEYLPKYGMLKLKSDLTFDLGEAVVKPSAKPALKKLGEIMNSPEAQSFHVYVAGHTDDVPLKRDQTLKLHGSNWGLSAHRALAVVKALAEAGMLQKRMAAVAFSKHHPIAPNAPKEKGNPANRRVELWIVPPNRFLTVGTIETTETTGAVAPGGAVAPAGGAPVGLSK